MAAPLTAEQVRSFHADGFVIVRGAFSLERIAKLRSAIERLCARAYDAEEAAAAAGDDAAAAPPLVPWLNREKRLPSRTGDYLRPEKYDPVFGAWMAEDAIPQLEQLMPPPLRHCRFQMLGEYCT